MDVFTVSLFGHREVEDLKHLESRLTYVIEALLQKKSYVTFLIGRNGEFDEFAASVIKRTRKRIGSDNSNLSLVLPYSASKIEDFEKYYDDIIIPENLYKAHPKVAITLKNRWMIEQSDLIIAYVNKNSGGAYTAIKHAQKLDKKIINLYDIVTDE